MDKALEKLDEKDGTDDNKVSVSAVKKAAKKEGYTIGGKKQKMAKKMKVGKQRGTLKDVYSGKSKKYYSAWDN